MKPDEKVAYDYFVSRGFDSPVYEPNGNVSPDFLVDGHIAVEVRRLNQHHKSENEVSGLEEAEYPLRKLVEKTLASMGPAADGGSWFVNYDFQRPLPCWKVIEAELRAALQKFLVRPEDRTDRIQLCQGIRIDFLRAGDPLPQMFHLGMYSDWNAGGWVLGEMSTNIEICIVDKAEQLTVLRREYDECWLVLVDHIANGMSERDVDELRSTLSVLTGWDKIIVIDRLNFLGSFELTSTNASIPHLDALAEKALQHHANGKTTPI